MKRLLCLGLAALALTLPELALGAPGLPAVSVTTDPDGGQTYSVGLQVLALMTGLTLLPAALIMMTAFTRIIIVLAILRQALGSAQTPSSQVLVGLALFLTIFVMAPVFEQVYQQGVQPYLEEELTFVEALSDGVKPLRAFMLAQTREADLAMFSELAGQTSNPPGVDPSGSGPARTSAPTDAKLSVVIPAFVTSELKTAFQFGFLLFIPFLIIDLVVASVLMSMGMMMLSPLIISFPFKIMLFVLIDGWVLIASSLASSFFV